MSKFLKGTIILLAAGLITRVLGFINRIVIARFIGEEGVGLVYDGRTYLYPRYYHYPDWTACCHLKKCRRG